MPVQGEKRIVVNRIPLLVTRGIEHSCTTCPTVGFVSLILVHGRSDFSDYQSITMASVGVAPCRDTWFVSPPTGAVCDDDGDVATLRTIPNIAAWLCTITSRCKFAELDARATDDRGRLEGR